MLAGSLFHADGTRTQNNDSVIFDIALRWVNLALPPRVQDDDDLKTEKTYVFGSTVYMTIQCFIREH